MLGDFELEIDTHRLLTRKVDTIHRIAPVSKSACRRFVRGVCGRDNAVMSHRVADAKKTRSLESHTSPLDRSPGLGIPDISLDRSKTVLEGLGRFDHIDSPHAETVVFSKGSEIHSGKVEGVLDLINRCLRLDLPQQ